MNTIYFYIYLIALIVTTTIFILSRCVFDYHDMDIFFYPNHNNNIFENYIYLISGFIILKKNKIFTIDIWHKYFDNMFEQYDLMYIYNYLDFKRLAFSSVLKQTQLVTKSYYSFNYGVDEIWINHVLKKILMDNNLKDKLTTYICKDYNINFLLTRLTDNLKYNSIVNKEEFSLFIKDSAFNSIEDLEEKIQKYILAQKS